MSSRQEKYAETYRRSSLAYQHRTQKSKTITHRIGSDAGRVVSSRVEIHYNQITRTIQITSGLWHCGQAIYPSRRKSPTYRRPPPPYRAYNQRYARAAMSIKTITARIGKHEGRVIALHTSIQYNTTTDHIGVYAALWFFGSAIYAGKQQTPASVKAAAVIASVEAQYNRRM